MGEWDGWMDGWIEKIWVKKVSVCVNSTLRQLQQVKWHLGIFLYVRYFFRLCFWIPLLVWCPRLYRLAEAQKLYASTQTQALLATQSQFFTLHLGKCVWAQIITQCYYTLHSQHCHKRRYNVHYLTQQSVARMHVKFY